MIAIISNDHLKVSFSNKIDIFEPYLFVKYATKKNLKPLVKIQVRIKTKML
jgi:hypothetical protein